ncbi:MAG: YdbC family protein [Candidatus Saccharibacteria bacterium]
MADVSFEVIKTLGVLSEGSKGWQKEVGVVSWNGRSPKLDIREWSPEHERMGKGVTLNKDELLKLKEILAEIDVDELEID